MTTNTASINLNDPNILEIQKAITDEKQVFGSKVTIKKLKQGLIKKIFLTSNVSSVTEQDIIYYAQFTQVPVEKIPISNEELCILCKKPFLIGVVSVLK